MLNLQSEPSSLRGATLSWDITKACNLACGHCSNADDRAHAGKDLKIENAAHLLAEFVDAGGVGLHILGGEPLLRKDILTAIALARELQLTISITTNGTLLPSAEVIEWLLTKLATLTFSIDGHTPAINDSIRGVGTFSKATQTLRAFKQCRLETASKTRLNVSHVLCKDNVAHLIEMLDCAARQGADEISVTYLKPFGNALNLAAPEAAHVTDLRDAFVAASQYAQNTQALGVTLFEVPLRMQDWLRTQSFEKVRFGGDAYCDTAEGQLRLSSDGNVFPCFAGTKQRTAFSTSANEIKTTRIQLKEILDTGFFTDFKKAAHQALLSTPWNICQECTHFHARACYPGCPFEPENVKPRLCQLLEAAR